MTRFLSSLRGRDRGLDSYCALAGNGAFSLVEVVLALGITSVALLAIFAMFSSPLQSNQAIVEQQEVLGIARALPIWLQDQLAKSGTISTIYSWVQSPVAPTASAPIYAYCLPVASGSQMAPNAPAQVVLCSGADATSMANSDKRQGRLFSIYLVISPNCPIEISGTTVAKPVTGNLPADGGAYILGNTSAIPPRGNPALAIQARIYAIQNANARPGNAIPSLTYDAIIPCF